MIDLRRLGRYADMVGLVAVVALAGGVVLGASTTTGPDATVTAGTGFGVAETDAAGVSRWAGAASARLDLFTHRDLESAVMRLAVQSFARPRSVTVSVAGRPVMTLAVPASGFRRFTVPLGRLPRGPYVVVLRAVPGPQSIAATLGTADSRRVSIRVLEPVSVEDAR